MVSFLYRIAQVYYQQFDSEISRFTFVFPNRRAGIFFRYYLSTITDKPVFSPEILTIDECFASASNYQLADRLSNLFKIYKIYKELSKSDETFDSFVFWGEMLLNDFEDIDKYKVDARQLFTNITELKEIDQLFKVFSEKQLEAIRQFWKNFVPVIEGKTSEEFISIWKILYAVYEQFHAELKAEGTATEGMICRDVVERLNNRSEIEAWNDKQFVFIGFNALNPCEKSLMSALQKRGQADFYWDYEANELRDVNNPASYFFAENTSVFPSKLSIEPIVASINEKDVQLIAVPSAVGQTRQVYSILNNIYPETDQNTSWINTAVVLPDENLLVPLLHAIPEQIRKVNVTMGYPMNVTPVSGLIEHIFDLQKRLHVSGGKTSFYFQSVMNIINHQYITLLAENEVKAISSKMIRYNWVYVNADELTTSQLLSTIFTPQTDPKTFLSYLLEIMNLLQEGWKKREVESSKFSLESDFLYQYYISINRIDGIIKNLPEVIDLSIDTLIKLIRQLTSGITIPFVGEPLEGLQIMGVLETRGIDFDNLIITSFNEGVYPKKNTSNSFIPYNLRRGFSLPTFEHHDAITSYNFYRLIHRAKRIFFLYDSRTEGMQTGEISRFIHQLIYHYGVNIKKKNVNFDISFGGAKLIQITKTPAIMKKLDTFSSEDENASALSASSIKTYIDCPLQFYLSRVEKLEQTDEIKETIEDDMFGNLFHATMEYLYQPFKGKIMQNSDFDEIIANPLLIEKQIKKAFCVKYFNKPFDENVTIDGNNLLISRVIHKYVKQVLKTDKKYAPFKYIDAEKRCKMRFPISKREVNLKGFIDRIDEKEGKIRILDYKTGTGNLEFKSWNEVFEHNNDKRPKYVLQTFLYGLFYKNEAQGKIMIPGIYYMRDVFKDSFVTELIYKPDKQTKKVVDDFSEFEEEFTSPLTTCLEEIFGPAVPFFQTTSTEPCKYCSYTSICNR